jgi:hypothetical protein
MNAVVRFRIYLDGFRLLEAQRLGALPVDFETLEQTRRFTSSLLPRGAIYLIVPVVDGSERRQDTLRERTPA